MKNVYSPYIVKKSNSFKYMIIKLKKILINDDVSRYFSCNYVVFEEIQINKLRPFILNNVNNEFNKNFSNYIINTILHNMHKNVLSCPSNFVKRNSGDIFNHEKNNILNNFNNEKQYNKLYRHIIKVYKRNNIYIIKLHILLYAFVKEIIWLIEEKKQIPKMFIGY